MAEIDLKIIAKELHKLNFDGLDLALPAELVVRESA